MKDWTTAHPWMTFFLALSLFATLRVIFLGFDGAFGDMNGKRYKGCQKGHCNNPENEKELSVGLSAGTN